MKHPKNKFQGLLTVLVVIAWWHVLKSPHSPSLHLPELALIFALVLYFQLRSAKLNDKVNYSLGVAFFMPTLFNFGVVPAMVINPVAHVITGILQKKPANSVWFNYTQLMFSAYLAGLTFQASGGVFSELRLPESLLPMIVAAFVYAVSNYALVTMMISLEKQNSWLLTLKLLNSWGLYNYLLLLYVGVVFALFGAAYGWWGLLVFSVLLVGGAQMLQLGLANSVERRLRQQAEEELVIEPKTEVYNFRYLNEWVNTRDKTLVSVLFIDLDDYKEINDLWGHGFGDQILKAVAHTIRETVGPSHGVVRFGGEEFVVLLSEIGPRRAVSIAEQIQENLAYIPEMIDRNKKITASIGVASYPQDAKDKHELLQRADYAMYKAKSRGKNQCCLWCDEETGGQQVAP